MRRLFFFCLAFLLSLSSFAQVPNFGTTVGNARLYGYSSMKYRVNSNTWETYSTLQYGIGNYSQVGVDLYTGGGNTYIGYIVRGGVKVCDYFKIGGQLTPSFDLNDKHNFSYLTSALYINGNISSDGRWFYVTDTWFENNRTTLTSAKQWTYIGRTISFPNSDSMTPMAGIIHSWKFDQDPDLSLGCYYSHKNINLYVWANDIFTKTPRFVLALEFAFSNN